MDLWLCEPRRVSGRRRRMSAGAQHPGSPLDRPRITILPTSNLGRWGVGLAVAFFPLVFAATVVPRGAALGLVCGLAGGLAALMAIVRDRERAVTVFAALLPVAIAVAFVFVELITGNP
jgi:hypothetical protein